MKSTSHLSETIYGETEEVGGAKSGALGDLPIELQVFMKAWSDLPDAGKVRIMAILLEESNSNVE